MLMNSFIFHMLQPQDLYKNGEWSYSTEKCALLRLLCMFGGISVDAT